MQLLPEHDQESSEQTAEKKSIMVMVMDFRRVEKDKALGGVHFPADEVMVCMYVCMHACMCVCVCVRMRVIVQGVVKDQAFGDIR